MDEIKYLSKTRKIQMSIKYNIPQKDITNSCERLYKSPATILVKKDNNNQLYFDPQLFDALIEEMGYKGYTEVDAAHEIIYGTAIIYRDECKFHHHSIEKLSTCDLELQRLFAEVIRRIPLGLNFKIVCGHRNKKQQKYAFKIGRSLVEWPSSRHNVFPSLAIDILPLTLNENKKEIFYELSQYIKQTAKDLEINNLIWFGDRSENFIDLMHWEINECQ